MNIFKKFYCRAFQIVFRVALPIMPYKVPAQMGSLNEIPDVLKENNIGVCLVVADKTVRDLGLIKNLEKGLASSDIAFAVYEQATPNPTIADIEKAREVYVEAGAQAIIAVGGGSAMDCAKIVGARIARPNMSIRKMKGILKIWKKTPLLIAVPTTAGTGSETTLAAVITDGETHLKYPINDFPLIPDMAVLDPNLTVGLPAGITATTGLDALTHAVEAYIGRSTNKFTRQMSVEAVSLIRESLTEAVENGKNIEAREKMLRAAFCAGIAFTRSYVGYVHGIAHSLGGQYGIAHGLANAVILPVFLREYGDSVTKKLARLARESGVVTETLSDEETAEHFIVWVEGMNSAFGLPKGFPEIQEKDIPKMAGNADKESNPLYPVPRLMDKEQLAEMYYKLMA